jgi:hypothetical protein
LDPVASGGRFEDIEDEEDEEDEEYWFATTSSLNLSASAEDLFPLSRVKFLRRS